MTDQDPDYLNVRNAFHNSGKNVYAKKLVAIMSAWRLGRTCEASCDPRSDYWPIGSHTTTTMVSASHSIRLDGVRSE